MAINSLQTCRLWHWFSINRQHFVNRHLHYIDLLLQLPTEFVHVDLFPRKNQSRLDMKCFDYIIIVMILNFILQKQDLFAHDSIRYYILKCLRIGICFHCTPNAKWLEHWYDIDFGEIRKIPKKKRTYDESQFKFVHKRTLFKVFSMLILHSREHSITNRMHSKLTVNSWHWIWSFEPSHMHVTLTPMYYKRTICYVTKTAHINNLWSSIM